MQSKSLICMAFFMGTLMFPPQTTPSPESSMIVKKFVSAEIGKKIYVLEVADTIHKKGRGLSWRISLEKNKGMLFVFNNPGNYEFCMENMNFPLDFIWIRGDRIVGLFANVPTAKQSGTSERISIKERYDKVIEFNAGEIKKCEVKIGNLIKFR